MTFPDVFHSRGTRQDIYLCGYKKAILYSGVLSIDHTSIAENIGISTKHSTFSDFPLMLKEAVQSFKGGYIYSDNKTVAEIQLSLAERFKEKFILKEIAEEFYLSEAYLFELFRKNTNTTIINFIKNIRMHHATNLLKYTNVSIKDIADSVGYEDAGYFGRLFRREYQCSPEQFRKQVQE
jgi:AraC-like DNA-binding protein